MLVEGLDCGDVVFGWDDEIEDKKPFHKINFHNFIAKEIDQEYQLTKPIGKNLSERRTHDKISFLLQSGPILNVNGNVTVGGEIRWGGDKGVEFSGYAKAGAQDDRGNRVEVKVEQNSDGTGRVDFSATHDYEKSNPSPSTDKNE